MEDTFYKMFETFYCSLQSKLFYFCCKSYWEELICKIRSRHMYTTHGTRGVSSPTGGRSPDGRGRPRWSGDGRPLVRDLADEAVRHGFSLSRSASRQCCVTLVTRAVGSESQSEGFVF